VEAVRASRYAKKKKQNNRWYKSVAEFSHF
jgi:hypothetical protein